jgi:hypothetical protein
MSFGGAAPPRCRWARYWADSGTAAAVRTLPIRLSGP